MAGLSALRGVSFLLILLSCCLLGLPYILFPWMILFFVSRSWFHYVCHSVMSSWFRLVPILAIKHHCASKGVTCRDDVKERTVMPKHAFARITDTKGDIPRTELVYGVKVTIAGDLSQLQSPCLIILNHRTRFDWLFLWCYLLRKGNLCWGKIILKKQLKHVPGFGWAMQILLYLFLSRNWASDEAYLRHMLCYLVDCKYPLQLVIFPEGTDLSDHNRKKSHAFAAKYGLRKYEYVMHPRTKGFLACMESLRKGNLKVVTDIDIAYKGPMPQNERDILFGNWPTEIHIRVQNHLASNLPADGEQLEEWLKEMWQRKEERLEYFYNNGKFQDRNQETVRPLTTTLQMVGWLIFWTMFHIVIVLLLTASTWLLIYGIVVLLLLLLIDRYGGFDCVELSWHCKHCQRNRH